LTAIELSVAAETVMLNAGLVIEPGVGEVAVMPVVPELATAVTSPVVLTVAIAPLPVFQVEVEVRSLVVPSV